jgi:hypothetical protein
MFVGFVPRFVRDTGRYSVAGRDQLSEPVKPQFGA